MNQLLNEEIKSIIDLILIFFIDIPSEKQLNTIIKIDENEIENEHLLNILRYIKQNPIDKTLEELNIAYVKLFTQPKDFKTIPIASYHLSENKTLVSKLTLELKEIYLNNNYILNNEFIYKEDHIVPIISFLKFINNKDDFKKYFDKYVKSWVPQFAKILSEVSDNTIYKNLGLLLIDLLNILEEIS